MIHLVHPDFQKYTISQLKASHDYKIKYFAFLYNLAGFLILIFLVTVFLFSRYKGKLTNREKAEKLQQQSDYIWTQIKKIEHIRNDQNHNLITDIPYPTVQFDLYNKLYF